MLVLPKAPQAPADTLAVVRQLIHTRTIARRGADGSSPPSSLRRRAWPLAKRPAGHLDGRWGARPCVACPRYRQSSTSSACSSKELGWVTDLLVAGSLATGDYVLGVSDLELVAVVNGQVDARRMTTLARLYVRLDEERGAGLDLGCVDVNGILLVDRQVLHPTWTHGALVQRILSGLTRAELVRHGFAVFGRPPRDVFAPMSTGQVQEAARAELLGYWTWAARRPWLWLDPAFADLGRRSSERRWRTACGSVASRPCP